jgi:hypothetical protein
VRHPSGKVTNLYRRISNPSRRVTYISERINNPSGKVAYIYRDICHLSERIGHLCERNEKREAIFEREDMGVSYYYWVMRKRNSA